MVAPKTKTVPNRISEKKFFYFLAYFSLLVGRYYTVMGLSDYIPRSPSFLSTAFNRCPPFLAYPIPPRKSCSGDTHRTQSDGRLIIFRVLSEHVKTAFPCRFLETIRWHNERRITRVVHNRRVSRIKYKYGRSDIILITTLLRTRMNNSFCRVSCTPHTHGYVRWKMRRHLLNIRRVNIAVTTV